MGKLKISAKYIVLAISLCVNLYFLYTINKEKAVVKIEGTTVLTEKQLNDELSDNYKVMFVNQVVNDYLLKLEVDDRGIPQPTQKELDDLLVKFPEFYSLFNDINNDKFIEIYNVYTIFEQNGISRSTVQKFLENQYGDSNAKLYEIDIYTTNNHSDAQWIEAQLRTGKSTDKIQEEKNVQFLNTYTISMDSVLSDNSESTNFMDMDMDMDDEISSGVSTYAIGDVFHIMQGDSMQIIQIKNIMSVDTNFVVFEDLYFSKNYISIKNDIINELKGKYVVTYY